MTNTRSRDGIMKVSRIALALAAAAVLALVRAATMSADQAPPVNVPGIDKPVIVVTGDVGVQRDVDQRELLRPARGRVRAVRQHAEHRGRHPSHRRVGQRRHADRRARRPAQRHRHGGCADCLHQRSTDWRAWPWRLGRPHHQRPCTDSTSKAARPLERATLASTEALIRTTTAASCAMCASSSGASSSAPTTS